MKREKGGHERARPEGAGHPQEKQEEESGVRDVEQEAHQVVTAGVEPEELDVHHVGEPGHGVPVARR